MLSPSSRLRVALRLIIAVSSPSTAGDEVRFPLMSEINTSEAFADYQRCHLSSAFVKTFNTYFKVVELLANTTSTRFDDNSNIIELIRSSNIIASI